MKQAALFIGIDTYTPPIQSLICARSDAEELYQFFLQHYSPGFVKFLYDGKATANAIMEKIETLMKPLEAGDTFLLYFSGHGTQFQGKHVLVGPDSRYIGEEWTNTISMNQVNALTEKAGVRRFFIIDSCRSPLLAGARAVGNNDVQTRNVCMKAMSEEKTGTLGIIPPAILCSCSSGEQAYEIKELQHGAFTQAMLEIFREAGKWLDLSAFDKKICPKITALLKKYNLPQKQTPQQSCTPGENMLIFGLDAVDGANPQNPAGEEHAASQKTVPEDDPSPMTKLEKIKYLCQQGQWDLALSIYQQNPGNKDVEWLLQGLLLKNHLLYSEELISLPTPLAKIPEFQEIMDYADDGEMNMLLNISKKQEALLAEEKARRKAEEQARIEAEEKARIEEEIRARKARIEEEIRARKALKIFCGTAVPAVAIPQLFVFWGNGYFLYVILGAFVLGFITFLRGDCLIIRGELTERKIWMCQAIGGFGGVILSLILCVCGNEFGLFFFISFFMVYGMLASFSLLTGGYKDW